MKAAIGVYDSHESAIDAVRELKEAGYNVKHLSIIGKADIETVDEEAHVKPKNPLHLKGLGAGAAIGTSLGVLAGAGLFAIPGLGFLFGAGALVGAIAGFDFGLIGGGIASVLNTIGVEGEMAKKYQEDLVAGKYLIVAQGSQEDVHKAIEIVESHGKHEHVAVH